jgi:hypothetical protein
MSTPDRSLSDAMTDLSELISDGGWVNRHGQYDNMVVLIRPWSDGSVDTIALSSVNDAIVERTNLAGEVVWHQTGTVSEVIAGLRAVPAPSEPDAPRQVIGARSSRLWTPE